MNVELVLESSAKTAVRLLERGRTLETETCTVSDLVTKTSLDRYAYLGIALWLHSGSLLEVIEM